MWSRYLLVDPTSEEEDLLNSVITIAYSNRGQLCLVYKPGGTVISTDQMKECIQHTKEKIKQVEQILLEQTFNT